MEICEIISHPLFMWLYWLPCLLVFLSHKFDITGVDIPNPTLSDIIFGLFLIFTPLVNLVFVLITIIFIISYLVGQVNVGTKGSKVINCIYRWLFVVIFSIVSLTTFSQNFKYNYPCPKDTKNIKVPIIQLDIIDTVYVDNLYNNQIILPEKENKLIEDNEFIFYIIIVIFITIILLLMNYFFKKINNILNTLD